jgi:cytochrome c553
MAGLRQFLAVFAAVFLAACSSVPTGNQAPGAPLDQAALLTASCSGCHGPGGSPGGIAPLDGLSAAELEAKLLVYRNDSKGGSAMHRMARGYTEQQIAIIAGALGD